MGARASRVDPESRPRAEKWEFLDPRPNHPKLSPTDAKVLVRHCLNAYHAMPAFGNCPQPGLGSAAGALQQGATLTATLDDEEDKPPQWEGAQSEVVLNLASGLGGVGPPEAWLDGVDTASEGADAQAYVSETTDGACVTMSVRGTEMDNVTDMLADVNPLTTRWEPLTDVDGANWRCDCLGGPGAMVHLGFYEQFLELRGLISSVLVPAVNRDECREVRFAGHSLGGAIAHMCMLYFLTITDVPALVASGKRVTFFSIGQPRAGNTEFAKLTDRTLAPLQKASLLSHVRLVNDRDWVPTYPWLGDFRHAGHMLFCRKSEEDTWDFLVAPSSVDPKDLQDERRGTLEDVKEYIEHHMGKTYDAMVYKRLVKDA